MVSVGFGGPLTSLDTFACHSGLPLASNASTSPFSVPTTTRFASAPTPADRGMPALTRQRWAPAAGATLTTLPAAPAAETAGGRTAGANPPPTVPPRATCQLRRGVVFAW